MPRISDDITDCAVYIYRSMADARSGERQGGSGFLTLVPFDKPGFALGHPYVVTNRHVVVMAESPVVRFNRKDGSTEFVQTEKHNWKMHQDGDDIAILPIQIEAEPLKHTAFPVGLFVTPMLVENEDIGIGDDTVMVGRFINHEGRQQNAPAVRFGNIAMMANEKITSPYGIEQESFLVEIRSLPGYSGSAVFLYSPCAMNDMSVRRHGIAKTDLKEQASGGWEQLGQSFRTASSPKGPYLLGIDWCHIKNKNVVRHTDGSQEADLIVEENTGMAGVIPAWKIIEVLFRDDVVAMRQKAEKDVEGSASGISLDAATDR